MKFKKIFFGLMAFLVFGTAFLAIAPKASAFNASNLMDDGIFERSNSMSAAQIDAFLNSFPSSCIRSQSGFVTPDPQGWSSSQGQYLYGGNVTAGTAIYDTAQLYHVNPQVILATLQKEQSIPSGSAGCHPNTPDPNAPFSSSPAPDKTFTCTIGGQSTTCTYACTFSGGCMTIAVGYNCPGYCKASSEGFSKQITLGTWLLRWAQQRAYGNLTGYAGYEQGDENFTYVGAMTQGDRKRCASCSTLSYDGTYTTGDGVTIHVANGATASLYNFTPFTSGNNNFDTIFQNWFGSIYDVYTWSLVSQYAYTDQTKTTGADLTNQLAGQKVYIGFQARNTGTATWSKTGGNPVRVGTTSPNDRSSSFCDMSDSPSWIGCGRPAAMAEASVAPGGVGTFEFWYKIPAQAGTYDEHFSLLAEGLKWMNDPGMFFHTVVKPPTYSWSLSSQYAYTDQAKNTGVNLADLNSGQRIFIGFTAKNTGNVPWNNSGANPVRVGTSTPQDRNSPFCDVSWLNCSRPTALKEASIAPGQIGTFEFWYQAPSNAGTFQEHFRPLVEGLAWMNDIGLNYSTVVHFDKSGADTLGTNQALNVGQSITSSDGRYRLILQGDGNLVLYSINRALWSSNTHNTPVTKLVMQGDGNLVLYDAQNKAYWSSGTAGMGISRLIIQPDGNLVIYTNGGSAIWATRTNGQF